MSDKVATWLLRFGAWACLLCLLGWPLLKPRETWVRGRLFQMQVLFESRQAADDFARELGLHRHFDMNRYRIHYPAYAPCGAPTWLTILDRGQEDPWGPYLWLETDGSYLLPAAGVYSPHHDAVPTLPAQMRLSGSQGEIVAAAIVNEDAWWVQRSGHSVWLHRSGRWVNVLRIHGEGHLAPRADSRHEPVDAVAWEGRRTFNLTWNAARQIFEAPLDFPTDAMLLTPLPDQTETRFPPEHLVARADINACVDRADLDGLLAFYEAASAEYGIEIHPEEELLNSIGYELMNADKLDSAIRAFHLNVDLYPESADAYDSLGRAFEHRGELEKARSCYQQACERARQANDPNLPYYKGTLDAIEAKLGGG